MKTLKFILIFTLAITFTSCNAQQKENKQTKTEVAKVISKITPNKLEAVDKSVQLVDVRTPNEYALGHIKHATNINFFDGDFIEKMSKLDKNKAVYIYCKSGGRSGRAAQKLKAAGFKKVYDLQGGFMNWQASGKHIYK